MKKTKYFLAVPVICVLLSGCTLTPARFDGYDLLDTEHKTEQQDPVIAPVKEHSDGPVRKSSKKTNAAPVSLVKKEEGEKPVVKPPEKSTEKSAGKSSKELAPLPPIKKQKKIENPGPKETCPVPKKGDLPPPSAPTAKVMRDNLRSGDRLKITVFRENDLSGIYQINDKGKITFPLLGQVDAAGMKKSELQNKVTSALEKGYLVKPEVNVELLPDCLTK